MLSLKQTELGRRLGVHQVAIAQWETGARAVPLRHMNRLLKMVARGLLDGWISDLRTAKKIDLKIPLADAARSPSRQRADLRRRAQLLALTMLSGGSAHLRREEWCDLLYISAALLRDVPADDQGLCAGSNVGLAIVAAHRGLSYSELIATFGPAETIAVRQLIGEQRIALELIFVLQQHQMIHEVVEDETRKKHAGKGRPA